MSEVAATGRVVTVTDDTFADVVLRSNVPVVVDFWATWCPPCKPLARVLEGLAEEFGDALLVASLDSDDNPQSTGTYRVMAMPTLVFFRGGEVVDSIVGSRPASVLRQAFTELVSADRP